MTPRRARVFAGTAMGDTVSGKTADAAMVLTIACVGVARYPLLGMCSKAWLVTVVTHRGHGLFMGFRL
jgi:hypothetical protein